MSVGTWPCSRPKRNNVAAQKARLHMRLLMRFLVRFRVQNVPYPTLSEGFVAITVSSPWSISLQVLDLSRNSRPSWSFSSMGMAPLSASRFWIREKVVLALNNLRSMGLQNKLPNADMRVRASSKIILLPENSQFSTRRRSFLQTSRNHVIVPVQITWCDCKFLSRIQVSDLSFFHPSPEAVLRQFPNSMDSKNDHIVLGNVLLFRWLTLRYDVMTHCGQRFCVFVVCKKPRTEDCNR